MQCQFFFVIAAGPSKFHHIGSLDIDLPGTSCPSPLHLKTFGSNRLCEKSIGAGCVSITISAGGQTYQKVRGRVAGYAYNSPDAFRRVGGAVSNIDDSYVDGVSITHGNPRKHVWSYALANNLNSLYTCPAVGEDITKQPAFVGSNFICVVANQTVPMGQDKLFDAPMWTTLGNCFGDCPDDLTFCVTLDQPTSDDLEVRLCTDQDKFDEDVFIKSFDFYVQ